MPLILCPDPARHENRSGKPEVCRSKPAACRSIRTAALCGAPRAATLVSTATARTTLQCGWHGKPSTSCRTQFQYFKRPDSHVAYTVLPLGQRRLRRSGSPELSDAGMPCDAVQPRAVLRVRAQGCAARPGQGRAMRGHAGACEEVLLVGI